jgi:hypothetical protein
LTSLKLKKVFFGIVSKEDSNIQSTLNISIAWIKKI